MDVTVAVVIQTPNCDAVGSSITVVGIRARQVRDTDVAIDDDVAGAVVDGTHPEVG